MSSRSSKRTTSDPPTPSGPSLSGKGPSEIETVQVGLIRKPHGIRGEVTVESLSDVPGRLAAGSRLLVAPPMGRHRLPATVPTWLEVVRSRPHKGVFLVTFDQVDDRDGGEALAGCFLEVPIDEVPPAEPGTWYWFQLQGCRCVDRTAGDLGTVVDLAEDGGGLLLLVEDAEGTSLPVPFVDDFLVSVDVEARRIDLDLPSGLIETCASRR